ncbi:hypothetical protein [Kiloniella sp. EL199]|uniref:hypothetical protein n=1 Tax=Kiloniella sp. EL199 TaxID=2107581 RepID=UPI000EA0F018|nr:hypothetical protein [Kiloniella sp. EL199]
MPVHKYAEILHKQAQELKYACAQNSTTVSDDELKAIQRIDWIVSSLADKEIESTVVLGTHVTQMKKDIRNRKYDADEKLFHQLLHDNKKRLESISPDSLVRYVPLLEVPECLPKRTK